MKTLLTLILLATLAVDAASQSGRKIRRTAAPTPAEPIQPSVTAEPALPPAPLRFIPESIREREIRSLDSGSFRLADFEGKVLVINVWASWCGPCRREVPEYEKVRKEYAGRNVEFIGLTTEDPRTAGDRVKRFLRDVSFGFRLGWADAATARTLMNGKESVPQTMVIDAEGRIVSHWTGYARGHSGDRLRETIDLALGK